MFSQSDWAIPVIEDDNNGNIQSVIDSKTKPPGSLGKLETLAFQLAKVQTTTDSAEVLHIRQPSMLVFAADHGIARHNVSIAPAEVTQQMVSNFLNGGAAINCFCRLHQVDLTVIDAGMMAPIAAHLAGQLRYIERRVAAGTADMTEQPAMTLSELTRAMEFGVDIAHLHLNEGADVLGFGEMGIGNTSSAAALVCAQLNRSATDIVGRGTGITDEQFARKTHLIQRAVDRTRIQTNQDSVDVQHILASLGGFEIIQMIGAMLATAQRGKIIIVDGFIVSVAALFACVIAPHARQFMVFAHSGAERSHQLVLNELQASPLLQLDLRLGEGTGAVLAVPLLRTAAAFYNEMATFESANVNV